MKRPRIIPVLLINSSGVVKSTKFKDFTYIGDPINAVRIFNDLKVDELVLLDIDASKENRSISIDLVRAIGEEANMPFSVGGGIRSIETIRALTKAGAEKVILNTYALNNPSFIREAADHFGSSTISVAIDYKKKLFGSQCATTLNGTVKTNYSPLEAALLAEKHGAGELILQSIDRDGTMAGFDIETLQKVNAEVTIPVVALGGAGSKQDFEQLYRALPINAIAAGSFFVFQGKLKGVLIQYPSINSYNFDL